MRQFLTRRPVSTACALALAVGTAANPCLAIQVVFDYRFDSGGMFNDPARRTALEAAAAPYLGFTDQLSPIEPGNGNSWSLTITRPDSLFTTAAINDLHVPANSIVVFVAGFATHPSALGWANSDINRTVSGGAAWEQTITARGQAGALLSTPTDFGPWGGAITFNSNVNWHFDPGQPPSGAQPDFLTTAMHELGHLLGYGQADSWFSHISGSSATGFLFNGSASSSLYGGPVPLGAGASHWAEGTMGLVGGLMQGTLMDPSTPAGHRELMTNLDLAGFADIGWVPEPSNAVTLVVLSILGVCSRRHNARQVPSISRLPDRQFSPLSP